jgi:hypothetical protein
VVAVLSSNRLPIITIFYFNYYNRAKVDYPIIAGQVLKITCTFRNLIQQNDEIIFIILLIGGKTFQRRFRAKSARAPIFLLFLDGNQ